MFLLADREGSDQTARTRSLIRAFAVSHMPEDTFSHDAAHMIDFLKPFPLMPYKGRKCFTVIVNPFSEGIKNNFNRVAYLRRTVELRWLEHFTKTYLYNFDPLKPHFYIVKLGFTGVCIMFLISAQKHRLWALVRTASRRRF